jgi:TatA/E family protein of Tat protein translocase
MPNIGAPELIIILVIALLILGPGKLPEVGASLGKSIKEFRKASTDLQESVKVDVDTSPLPAAPVAAPVVAAPVAAAPVAAAPVATAPIVQAPAPVDVPAGGLGSGPTAPSAPASDSTTIAS